MAQRLNYFLQSPELSKKLVELGALLQKTTIETHIRELVELRTSQLNGCAFCVDMHVKMAKIHGERELRLHHVAIWRESTLFSPRERAALAWAEVLTNIPTQGVSDDIYDNVRAEYSEKESVGSHVPRGRDQQLEPTERGVPHGARLVRQGVRARQGRLGVMP